MESLRVFQLFFCFYLLSFVASDHHVCPRPVIPAHARDDGLQRFYDPGAELTLSCEEGYQQRFGPRVITCGCSGSWTATKLLCRPVHCPYPGDVTHGDVFYEDNTYQSSVNYSCHEGFTLVGDKMAVCLANGTWSTPVPVCTPVTCGLAPIPESGMIIYDRLVHNDRVSYGVGATYACLPPLALSGNKKTHCTARGSWTETPECRMVTCPPPQTIDQGQLLDDETRDFYFMETVGYDCNDDFVLEGAPRVTCQVNGEWSQKPSCKAHCTIGIERGRILYKGKKIWIENLKHNKVWHNDLVYFYCMDQTRKCGYAVPAQCMDGNLVVPVCFQEPKQMEYLLTASLPSEIQQC